MATVSPDYAVVKADQVEDAYADSDVPGEFRSLSEALGAEQLGVTLIRIPPHSDFEQGSGHRHEEIEEVYLVTKGTLTMRFGEEIETVGPGSAVRVAPQTVRSHRNEGDEPVEMWAISPASDSDGGEKVEDSGRPRPRRRSTAELSRPGLRLFPRRPPPETRCASSECRFPLRR